MEEVVVDIKAARNINETGDGKLTVCIERPCAQNEDQKEVPGTEDEVKESRVCRNFRKSGKCKQGDECKFRHDLNCTFFESSTGCKYGDQCPLQHYRGEADASYEQDSQVETEEELNLSTEGKELDQELQKLSLLEAGSGNDKSQKTCVFFKRGKCIKENCQFSHEKNDEDESKSNNTSNKVENSLQTKKICHFFQTEKGCKRTNCQFLHVQNTTNENGEEEIDQTATSALEKEDDDKISEESITRNSKEICKYFNRKGGCYRRDKCRNLHEKIQKEISKRNNVNHESSVERDFERAPNEIADKQESDKSQEQDNGKRKLCRYFKTKRGCRDGDNCRNLHEQQPASTDESEVSLSDQNKILEEKQEEGYDEKKIRCRFFKTKRGCRDGANCPNLHEKPPSATEEIKVLLSEQAKQSEDKQIQVTNEKRVQCRFFKTKRGCRDGVNCPNLHENQSTTIEVSEQTDLSDKSQKKPDNTVKGQIQVPGSNVPAKTPSELRATELKQLEKRWKDHFECLQSDPVSIYNVAISPTDPDWPFVVKDFLLQVEFPEDYPEQLFKVTLQENSQYPPYFCGFMNEILEDWREERIKTRNNQDLAFRPFCRWFDKKLKDNFQYAATKVKRQLEANAFGLTLVHHKTILPQNEGHGEENNIEDKPIEEECIDSMDDLHVNGNTEDSNQLFHDDKAASAEKCSNYVKKGTEIKLPHLQISEKIGTLRIRSGLLVVQCSRCRDKHDYKVFSKQIERGSCKKCHQEQSVVYHSELVHHFSPIAGYLHLTNCKAFDFIMNDSTIVLNCLDCNKDNIIKGLLAGTKKDHWCQHCNVKMEMKIPNIHFNHLQPAAAKTSVKGASKVDDSTKKKIPKEPGIKEGQPLPDNGTCKHYKKSHRWLRFPCCGKAYPCDICHEEGVEGDHEMKFATKMICGYCSKEQPFFKDKPCISCKSGVTKGRSAHWEGGKGCRDKSKMARGDKHKTQGQGKTVSKKKEDEGKKTKK